jgi:hypothetical protein
VAVSDHSAAAKPFTYRYISRFRPILEQSTSGSYVPFGSVNDGVRPLPPVVVRLSVPIALDSRRYIDRKSRHNAAVTVRAFPTIAVFLNEVDVTALVTYGFRLPNLAVVAGFTATGEQPLFTHVIYAKVAVITVCVVIKQVAVTVAHAFGAAS